MARYTTDDFGYNFTPNDETKSLVSSNSVLKSEFKTAPNICKVEGAYELYDEEQHRSPRQEKTVETGAEDGIDKNLYRYEPAKHYRGGENFFSSDESGGGGGGTTTVNPIELIGACCCCLTITFLIFGGILLSYVEYKNSLNPTRFAGAVLIVCAGGTFLFSCCVLCVGSSSDGLFDSSSNISKADPSYNEIQVRFRRLNDRYEKGCMKAEEGLKDVRLDVVGHMKEIKDAQRKEEKKKKEKEKKNREDLESRVKRDLKAGTSVNEICQLYRPVVFYIVFDGDMLVSDLELLRKQVSLIVGLGKSGHDQCVVSVTSPGGGVSQYGLAASQLVRIRKAGIHLTVCVDTVAASGGYMMASVADKICAAPFAVVGSIGVVTQIPNFQRFLNEHKIDAFLCTAGKHKRTIDMIGDVTEEGKAKLQEELDDIHTAFKDHVALARPKLKDSMDEVGTGEFWLAVQAKEKGLVDDIMTSDEYLESICNNFDIIEILEKKQKKPTMAGIFEHFGAAALSVRSIIDKVRSNVETPRQVPSPMAIV